MDRAKKTAHASTGAFFTNTARGEKDEHARSHIGMSRGYSAHSMHATLIITALENGATLDDVQRTAGHAESRHHHALRLLVVVDFMDPAQDQEIRVDSLAGLTSQVFEKIIVYKTCFGQMVETH